MRRNRRKESSRKSGRKGDVEHRVWKHETDTQT
jgi:hypothetical protein